MRTKHSVRLFVCGISCATPLFGAYAQTPVSSPATVQQLSVLNDQIQVLKSQLLIAQLNANIQTAKHQQATGADQTDRPVVPMLPATQPVEDPPTAVPPSLPQIISIEGRGGHLSADLLMPGGGEVVASPGLPLAGGLTVHDVSVSGVQVMQGGNLVPLPFATGTEPEEPGYQVSPPRHLPWQPILPPQLQALVGNNVSK